MHLFYLAEIGITSRKPRPKKYKKNFFEGIQQNQGCSLPDSEKTRLHGNDRPYAIIDLIELLHCIIIQSSAWDFILICVANRLISITVYEFKFLCATTIYLLYQLINSFWYSIVSWLA